MDRDGAVNAQAEILRDIFGFEEIPGARSASLLGAPIFVPPPELFESGGREKGSIDPANISELDPRRFVGVGIELPPETNLPDAYRIAVRCQREQDMGSPLVRRILQASAEEVSVVFTGMITTGPNAAPASATSSRPLKMGDSIGHFQITAGTLGLFVRRLDGEGDFILSNNHVLANTDQGYLGDDILWPGPSDGGSRPNDRVASLSDYVSINFNLAIANGVDAAIAQLDDTIEFDPHMISDLPGAAGPQAITKRTNLVLTQDIVQKVGRTTRGTQGRVWTVNESLSPVFDVNGAKRQAHFTGQISIDGVSGHFSKPGDSGAAIFNNSLDVVALLFAGSSYGGRNGGGLTYANPIDPVLAALGVTL